MTNGRIRVETRIDGETRAVGTIPQFDRMFYDQVPRDSAEAEIGGIKAKLNWKRGYGQVVSILVDQRDVEKLKAIGFERP
jgi:hypothetical protein